MSTRFSVSRIFTLTVFVLVAVLVAGLSGFRASTTSDDQDKVHHDKPGHNSDLKTDCPQSMAQLHIPEVYRPDPVLKFEPIDAGPYGIIWGYSPKHPDMPMAMGLPALDYRANIYHITDCPEDPVGDNFMGLDYLIALMGHEGLKFYKSQTQTMESGPDGIIAADDVVVIKINYQWSQRGGTNVDLLRGLIKRIVDHPDTFAGEIVVCENAQFASTYNFDRSENNAQDHGLSPHDVVVEFQNQGYTISLYDWTLVRSNGVLEYSDGNFNDGYIVYPYDGQINGRVSYPKFQTDHGIYISIKYGIWDIDSADYDRSKLKFINVPVLKSHHSTYGVTACVKDYMGVVTSSLSTNSHNAIRYGLLGAVLGEIQLADLNILDCIWVNANPFSGPSTSYAGATRRNELIASIDPVAADIWATKNILIPAFLDNDYLPPWPYPSADPDDPESQFREYLDNSMNQILLSGYDVTNDYDLIDVVTWSGAGDLDGDGVDDSIDNCPYDPNSNQADCNENGIGDICEDPPYCVGDIDGNCEVGTFDLLSLLVAWGACSDPPAECAADLDDNGAVSTSDLLILLTNWGPCK